MAVQSPILKKPIPVQAANPGKTYGPFDLNLHIQSPNPESGKIRFTAELIDGSPLPLGMACSEDGQFTWTPPKEAKQGEYEVVIIAENESGIPLTTQFTIIIAEPIVLTAEDKGAEWFSVLKSKVWDALHKGTPGIELPDLKEMYERDITSIEIYYLMQRFATLTIWDAYNLDAPGKMIPLKLEGASPHYNVYDQGSRIIAAPKNLFSHERTLEDALQTARAMAREVYKREWTIQFAGFEKMSRAAWIELQHLGDKNKKYIEILHYAPSEEDIKLYTKQADNARLQGRME